MAAQKPEVYKLFLSFVAHIISLVPGHVVTKFQRLSMFSSSSCSTVLSTMLPEAATSGCAGENVTEPDDIENMDIGVEILFVAVLCAEITLLPVWAAAAYISGIMRLPMTSSTTTMNSWTSKTWV